jgi:adenylosuccinate lyase
VGSTNDLYKQAMTWREQIAGAFGFGTAPFAMHQSDEDLAKAAIQAAKAEGATQEDFAREIALYARKYVSSEGILRERLRRDSATLDKLWKASR